MRENKNMSEKSELITIEEPFRLWTFEKIYIQTNINHVKMAHYMTICQCEVRDAFIKN